MHLPLTLRSRYQEHLSQSGGSIFSQPWWWDAVAGPDNWSVAICEDSQRILAALPYYHGTKAGLISWVRMPPLTPYLEVSFAEKDGKESTRQRHKEKCIEQVIGGLPRSHYVNILLHPDTPAMNWNPLGLRSKLELTYVLPQIADHDFLFAQFESQARNHIRTAQKKLIIRPATTTELYQVLIKTFAKQKIKTPFGLDFLEGIIQGLEANGNYLMLCAIDSDDKIHAANLTVFDQHTAYNLITGSDPTLHQSGAVSYLMWHAIKQVSASVKNYNFEGGMIPRIASLYRSLGGEKKSYTRLYGSKNNLLTGALTMVGKF